MRASSISKTELLRFTSIYQGWRVMVLVLDGLRFVDLWGPISTEFFNS